MYERETGPASDGALMGTVEPRPTLQKVSAQIDQNQKGLLALVGRFGAIADHLSGAAACGEGVQPEAPTCGVIDGMDRSMRKALDLREALSYQAQRIEIALGIKSPDEALPSDAKMMDPRIQYAGQALRGGHGEVRRG